ncbi:MAG: hypothetical protein MJ200_02545 [Mycoplasmoidaceae bacterium]|nr:hypothetical protein [Mycoplasmoidaceae bacterium]
MINKLLYYPLNAFTYNDLKTIIIIFYSMVRIKGNGRNVNKRKSKLDLILEKIDNLDIKLTSRIDNLVKLNNLKE